MIDGQPGDLAEMQASIQEEFCGIGMFCYQEDFIEQLNIMKCYNNTEWVEGQSRELKRVVLEVDREAVDILTRKPHMHPL